jgi:hypothetical protein
VIDGAIRDRLPCGVVHALRFRRPAGTMPSRSTPLRFVGLFARHSITFPPNPAFRGAGSDTAPSTVSGLGADLSAGLGTGADAAVGIARGVDAATCAAEPGRAPVAARRADARAT